MIKEQPKSKHKFSRSNTVSLIAFVLIFAMLFSMVSYVLQNKNGRENISTFYEEPRNSLDVIFAGTSHALDAFQPMTLWEEYGIPAYNMAQSGQMLPLTYYAIEEALRFQTPKAVVVDVYYAVYTNKYGNTAYTHQTVDNMKWSTTKLRAILDGVNPKLWSEFFFPVSAYHSRWSELTSRDFSNSTNTNRGALVSYNTRNMSTPELLSSEHTKILSAVPEEYLNKIIDLCKKKNVSLIFTAVPYPAGEDNSNMSGEDQLASFNAVAELAEKRGVDFLNFFNLLEETCFDFETDMRDNTHVNMIGAQKITSYIGQYLVDNYGLNDRRSEEEYVRWNKDLNTFNRSLNTAKRSALKNCNSLKAYMELIRELDDLCVYMTLGGSELGGVRAEDAAAIQSTGIKTDFCTLTGHTWVAAFENGELTHEEISDEQIQHVIDYPNNRIRLFSNSTGSYFNIIITGDKVGKNKKGLNIVVYDKARRKVIDSVAFPLDIPNAEPIR